jgi:hypothetical protein
MGLFDWLLEHGEDERELADIKVLVPPRQIHVEEAEVEIIPCARVNSALS